MILLEEGDYDNFFNYFVLYFYLKKDPEEEGYYYWFMANLSMKFDIHILYELIEIYVYYSLVVMRSLMN